MLYRWSGSLTFSRRINRLTLNFPSRENLLLLFVTKASLPEFRTTASLRISITHFFVWGEPIYCKGGWFALFTYSWSSLMTYRNDNSIGHESGKVDNNPMVFLELPFDKIAPLRTTHFDSYVVMKATCVRMGFPTAYPIANFNLRGTLIKTVYHSTGKALPCWKFFHVCTAVCEQNASVCWGPWNFQPLKGLKFT